MQFLITSILVNRCMVIVFFLNYSNRGLFNKTSLPNMNQTNWQLVRLIEINLAYLVNLFCETGPWSPENAYK